MIDAIYSLLAQTSPIARGWVMLLGLAIAAIVLTVGLLALASLRRTRRGQAPTKTPYVDAWAESGRRATLDDDEDTHG